MRPDSSTTRDAALAGRTRALKRVISLLVAALVFLPFAAWPAKWDIVPGLYLSETYTDNVSLDPDALKKSDWVTQVTPAITVTGFGTGLRFRAHYAPQITYYAEGNGDNKVYQIGDAIGRAELAEKLLFLDAGGSINRYNISVQGPQTTENVNTTGNRTTVGTFFVSPFLLHNFGSAALVSARYGYSLVNSDDPTDSQDSESNLIDLRLASGPAYQVLSGDIAYTKSTISFDSGEPDFDAEILLANVQRLFTSTFSLLAQLGYEDYKNGGQSADGSRWGVGLGWTPSPRTQMSALAGRRFFGNAYYFDFSHRTRITTWRLGYSQDVTTTRTQFFSPFIGTTGRGYLNPRYAPASSTAGYLDQLYSSRFTDPVARRAAVDSAMFERGLPSSLSYSTNFFSSTPFLQKRLQASVAMEGVRNIIVANIFSDSRTLLPEFAGPTTGDFAVSNKINQVGTSALWNLRITPRDTWNLQAGYTRNKFTDTGRVDDVIYLRMGFRRQFQPRLYGSLFYRRQQKDSSENGSSYTENAVIGTLQMSF